MKQKKKNIHCLGWAMGPNSFGVTNTYLEFANKYGNARILMPDQIEPPKDCDMLIIPGGLDLMAGNVGQFPQFTNSNVDQFKEHFYRYGLKNYIESKIPIMAICLGFQQLCAYFNVGEYKQLLQWHPSSSDRYQEAHDLKILDSKLIKGSYNNKKKETVFSTNSHHKQGVLFNPEEGNKINGFIIDSIYDNGPETVIESMYHSELPIVACQFHPKIFGA